MPHRASNTTAPRTRVAAMKIAATTAWDAHAKAFVIEREMCGYSRGGDRWTDYQPSRLGKLRVFKFHWKLTTHLIGILKMLDHHVNHFIAESSRGE